jgi:hypothetical protein
MFIERGGQTGETLKTMVMAAGAGKDVVIAELVEDGTIDPDYTPNIATSITSSDINLVP